MGGRRALPASSAAAAAAVLLAGCGGGGGGLVSLAQLAQQQQSYAGSEVATRGTVLRERDPNGATYFVLADSAGDLVGLKPDATAHRYVGRRVDVTGRFAIAPGFGRVIRVATIAPA